jgi:tetratricopeptide (TPR) repeat protein
MVPIMTRITSTFALAIGFYAQIAAGQTVSEARKLYDAGQYQQVIAASGSEDPRMTFLRAQSYQKLSQINEARQVYEQLAGRPESDPWRDVGRAGIALLAQDAGGALAASNQAVARDGALPEAYYQQGLAYSAAQDFSNAATALQKASDLDPNWAYAHYYAGLAYSKVKRIDLTAQHFQAFLRLAPQAPERPEVQSIMRTLSR